MVPLAESTMKKQIEKLKNNELPVAKKINQLQKTSYASST